VAVAAPAEDLACGTQSETVFAADRDVQELETLLGDVFLGRVGCDYLGAHVEFFNLHGVHGLLDDEFVVVRVGHTQLQAVVLAPGLQVVVDA